MMWNWPAWTMETRNIGYFMTFGSSANPLNYLVYFGIFLPKKGSHDLRPGLGAGKIHQESTNCSKKNPTCMVIIISTSSTSQRLNAVLQIMKMKPKLHCNSSRIQQRKNLELFSVPCLRVAICFHGVLGKLRVVPEWEKLSWYRLLPSARCWSQILNSFW